MNYKNGRRPKSVPLAWRALVTTHDALIDRPKDPALPDKGWPERGRNQAGKPWVDGKTWAVARVLDDHMDKDGTCWVSYSSIAAQARISRTSAKEGVLRLVGAGLLERKQRRFAPGYSDSNLYRALGVGPQRPGGGALSADRWGPSGPQSPLQVVDPSDPSDPQDGTAPHPGKQMGTCAGCCGPLGYLIEGENPPDGALCLNCFNGR